jgi:hypothetical protein
MLTKMLQGFHFEIPLNFTSSPRLAKQRNSTGPASFSLDTEAGVL